MICNGHFSFPSSCLHLYSILHLWKRLFFFKTNCPHSKRYNVIDDIKEFIKRLIIHIPDYHFFNMRYYGFYSNASKKILDGVHELLSIKKIKIIHANLGLKLLKTNLINCLQEVNKSYLQLWRRKVALTFCDFQRSTYNLNTNEKALNGAFSRKF